jgi:phosphonoacetaldehyde hydrolase
VPDIEAGNNAGAVSVGVTETGNLLGLTAAELATLSPAARAARIVTVEQTLRAAGAHALVASAADLPAQLFGEGARGLL